MKSAGTILLLVSFFAQSFNQAFIVFRFYSNRSYYAGICENKARPMLHCNGKCQLAKKLKQQEKKDQQNPGRKLENRNEVIFFSAIGNYSAFFSIHQHNYFNRPDRVVIDFSSPIYHPPSA